jgi:type I restriction enzyme S subunit
MTDVYTTVGAIAETFDGPHATPKKTEEGPYFLSISSLRGGRLVLSESAHLSENDFVKWTKRVEPQEGDLLFSYETRLGEAALMVPGIRGCLGRRMGLLRPRRDKVLPKYLLYAYLSPYFQQVIQRNTITGATVKRIPINELPSFKIRIPPIPEQERIVDTLGAIDEKLEINERTNSALEAMAKLLYDYWFVQFDFPISAEQAAAMGKPHLEGKPYKSSGGRMEFNEELKREIPVGWGVRRLSHHLDCNSKKLGTGHRLSEIQYLDTSKLTKNVVGTTERLVIGRDKVPSRAKMVVGRNDILYSTVRPKQLHYGMIREPVKNMIASTGFAVLSHKTNTDFNSIFYHHITRDPFTRKLVKISESSRSSYPSISPDDILNLRISLPVDETLLKSLSGILNPIFDKVALLQAENSDLRVLRDWLLPMLMNGQVTVE